MKLFELSHKYQQVLAKVEEGAEGLEDTLEALNDAIEEKVENIGKIIKTVEAEAAGLKAEEQRMAERRRSLEANIKRMKLYAEQSMLDVGMKKIKGALFTFSIQKNPPSIEIVDEQYIPKAFYKIQEPVLDKKAILEELKLGHEIEGAQLKQGESLRIK